MLNSRQSALAHLEQFCSTALAGYAAGRNYAITANATQAVSRLSAPIKYRLISEEEVCAAVLKHSSLKKSEKFIQEVVWRTYWKAWLEMRPELWNAFQLDIEEVANALKRDSLKSECYEKALRGDTGIECFDDWSQALVQQGYLHNHARMWFASIWIFTLELPWQLGAQFFLKHLLDGDSASNTLSWRWVAGLQTRGKYYVATASNIKKFTSSVYNPVGQLNEEVEYDSFSFVGEASREYSTQQVAPADRVQSLSSEKKYNLILHPEDLSFLEYLKDCGFGERIESVSIVNPYAFSKASEHFSENVIGYSHSLVSDTYDRAAALPADCPVKIIASSEELASFLAQMDTSLEEYIIPFIPVGFIRDVFADAGLSSTSTPSNVKSISRDWDEKLYPYGTRGFFPFKKAVFEKRLLESLLGDRKERR